MIQMNGEKFQVSTLIKSTFNFSFSHRLFLIYALIFPHWLFLKFFHEPRTDRHLSLFEPGAPDRRWDALPYVSDISPPAFMKTGNQHINKTANNHKRNDIYIQPNQTEEACVYR